jgi:hypothetical protein
LAVATRVNFCTMGAISDVVNFGDSRRLRMWLRPSPWQSRARRRCRSPALSVFSASPATVGWPSLAVGGFCSLRRPGFGLRPPGAHPCGRRQLEIAIVLVFFAISAYMTLKGLFAVWRTVAPGRCGDVAALGAKTSDLPQFLAALGAGDAVKLCFVHAARRRSRAGCS